MTSRMDHPHGLSPPKEWWTEQKGHASTTQFREWMAMSKGAKGEKRAKFGQQAGWYEDIGMHCKSKLEAKTMRYLRFMGYQRWEGKDQPPADGLYVAYEWRKYRLIYKAGKPDERPLFYLPDWHLWDHGVLTIWESKGAMDQRSKRLLRLMEQQVSPVTLITLEEIEGRKAEALYAARRRREMVLDIPDWETGPKPKG